MTDWLIFGNCLTNPVGLAAKTFGNLNHLYHSPGDFFDLLFPKENKIKSWIKNCIKNFLKLEIYKIEKTKLPIYSLLKFKSTNFFHFIDYRAYNCDLVKNKLNKLRKSIRKQENNILLLVAGEEPEAGDKNFYNIKKYIKPHLLALAELKLKKKLSNSVVWVKEHKSYFPLSNYERNLLKKSFKTLNFKTKFVSDFMIKSYKILPGECIIRYCDFNYIIAEPSSFLFNVCGENNFSIAALSQFKDYRNTDQIARNEEFIKINNLLFNKVTVI